MSIRISEHAKERGIERGLTNLDLLTFARRNGSVVTGEFEVKNSVIVVRNGTVTTVLAKGMSRDSRM